MKAWLKKLFGKSQEPSPISAGVTAEPEETIPANPDRSIPNDRERTISPLVSAPVPRCPVVATAISRARAILLQQLRQRLANLAIEAHVVVEWKVGDVILDLYEVRSIHEGGGMGLVYRVHHRGWNMDLAVKIPRAEMFQSVPQRENFIRECETWINLGLHPYTVSCYYVRTFGGIPSIFAEYVDGGSLKEWIDSRKLYEGGPQAALARILDTAIQMAWGLHYAHEQALIHQDVKPANVLMTPDGTAKITDFGLAKARAAADESFVAAAGRSILVSVGGMTPAYCSPEQAIGEPLSRRTDIWSWGVSVMEMFTGEVAWMSGTVVGKYLEILVENGPIDETIPRITDGVAALLRKCFKRDPAARPCDFLAVVEELKILYRGITAEEYEREAPQVSALQASALNNRGVSLLDLGRTQDAERCFEEALKEQPGHPEAAFNRGWLHWQDARGTDVDILTALMQSQHNRPNDPTARYLTGLVHLERQDGKGAVEALARAEELGGGIEVHEALLKARKMESDCGRCIQVFEGHSEGVSCAALSADGRWVLSGSLDKTLRLWDTSNGHCVRTFEGHTDFVTCLALTADGGLALSGSWDHTLRLWDVSNGRCIRTIEGHTDHVDWLAWSADGCWALSRSSDRTLRQWNLSEGCCVRTFDKDSDEGEGRAECLALSADGRWALSDACLELQVWEVSSGHDVRTFDRGSASTINSAVLSADGCLVLYGSDDEKLRLWDVSSGNCIRTLEGHRNRVTCVALSPCGLWALSGSEDNTLRLWDLSTGRCVRTFEGHADGITAVAFSVDGCLALSGSYDRTLRLWEIGVPLWTKRTSKGSPVVCRISATDAPVMQRRFNKILSEAERAFASGAFAESVNLARQARLSNGYEFSTLAVELSNKAGRHGVRLGLVGGWRVRAFEEVFTGTGVALSADGYRALSGGGVVRLWEVGSGRCLRTFSGPSGESVAFSGDGCLALTGSKDGTLQLWEVSSGLCLRTFNGGHAMGVTSVGLSADGCWALSGGEDGALRLWEVSSGDCIRALRDHRNGVTCAALSPCGLWAISGSSRDCPLLWKLADGSSTQFFGASAPSIEAVAVTPDGRLALLGNFKSVDVWELSNRCCIQELVGHTDTVKCVAVSADSRWALTGSADRTLRLWELSSGRCVRTFEGHTDSITAVALSADGHWAVSASQDGTLQLWELDWEYEFPSVADFDEGARPYVKIFLTLHCAVGEDGFTRVGKPAWAEVDFQTLLTDLQYRGLGWLRPEGVRLELEKMAAEWEGPPLMPWEQIPSQNIAANR